MSIGSFLKKICQQECVYWAPGGTDNYGRPVYAEAVQLKCRWEDVIERFMTPSDEERVSKSKVFLLEDVELEGVLWLGLIDDAEGTGADGDNPSPFDNDLAYTIQRFDKVPDIRNKALVRIAYL